MIYACRWLDGTTSIASTDEPHDLLALLDEFADPTDGALLRPLSHLAMDFELDAEGHMRLRTIGAQMARELLEPEASGAWWPSDELLLDDALDEDALWDDDDDDDDLDEDEAEDAAAPVPAPHEPPRPVGPDLQVYLYRWADGRLSIVGALTPTAAMRILQEFGTPRTPGYLKAMERPLLVDITTIEGSRFALKEGFGEEAYDEIMETAYPSLAWADLDAADYPAKVQQERTRLEATGGHRR